MSFPFLAKSGSSGDGDGVGVVLGFLMVCGVVGIGWLWVAEARDGLTLRMWVTTIDFEWSS